jgi:ABC-type transporter Mla maintaining outer membrane lipid asymmetry ATPase subunit MlaF
VATGKKQPMVQFKGIMKRFGKVVAVEKMDFDIEEGSLVTLLGPSGCGKTTLLRMVAGLEDPTEGDIFIKGVRINDTPIHKRNLGMIFQNYALFPHKTIFDNVAFGLKYRDVPKEDVKEKGHPGPGDGAPARGGEPHAQPAFRRSAAAHRHGPGHRDRTGRSSDGRTAFRTG